MLKNFTIKARLTLLVGFMILMIILGGWSGIASLNSAINSLNELLGMSIDTSRFFNRMDQLYSEDIGNTIQKLNDQSISSEEGLRKINEAKNTINSEWENYIKLPLNSSQRKLANQTQPLIYAGNQSLDKLKTIIDSQDKAKLTDFTNKELHAFRDPIIANISKLNELHDEQTADGYQETLKHYDFLKTMIFITILTVVLISILFGIAVGYSILKPLKKAVDAINLFAVGNTDVQIEYQYNDEVGQLHHALKNMIDATNKMISLISDVAEGDLTVYVDPRSDKDTLGHALNSMVKRMGQMLGEIQKEMKTLRDNAQEIVASVTHASAGTSETAAAVTETTSTVEELKQTSTVAVEKADGVHQNSKDTMEIVAVCEQSLNSTISDMNEIHTKMDIISECIIKLSEHSISIGNIVDTVNDLAEQSNLLAVNAAIEAARVGEQGRGFGVVAQEIRVLAEQSKGATSQIRTILQDIQNATNNAVMATEQGAKAVAKGVKQSNQTNESMRALSDSFSDVAEAANHISSSSKQQLAAIDQVTTAILQINESSSQHADIMQQIKSATINLNSIGESVEALISQYQIRKNQYPQQSHPYHATGDRDFAKIVDKYVETGKN
jgi:methyl-accepting chemotaxis protein